MKRPLTLLLVCLMLCGCAAAPAAEIPVPEESYRVNSPSDKPDAAPIPGSGTVRAFPLEIPGTVGMMPFGEGLLALSGKDITTMTLLTGAELTPSAGITLDFFLDIGDPSLRAGTGALSFYDPIKKETVVLDEALTVVQRISLPGNAVGTPILSADGEFLYYCTSDSIRSLELDTGIRRCIKELSYTHQSLSGLHMDDTILQCSITDGEKERTLFLSCETGQTLGQYSRELSLVTAGSGYYALVPAGTLRTMVFGDEKTDPRCLFPESIAATGIFLPEKKAAVTVDTYANTALQLDYYDLDTGLRCCTLSLATEQAPGSIVAGADGAVYILTHDSANGCDTVYRWDVAGSGASITDGTVYTYDYHSPEEPDPEALAQCQNLARTIGNAHGIEILIWKDAAAVQPWDYDLEAEYLAPVIRRELEQLQQRLAQYPDGFLAATAAPFTSVKICLVRQITGTAESGSLETATGLQFLEGTDAYVVIATGENSHRALYHELFHVMETRILNESIAFDQWDSLNPSGFSYDYDYLANADRDAGIYLHRESRAFIDIYSMSFPKEDRARIMEYAMLPGNEELFQADILQKKLAALCEGIREAYGLEKAQEKFLWEQYLK